jgi:hypothetical protein
MLAWKFLASGTVGPYSKFVWPKPFDAPNAEPGAWVTAESSLSPCARGIHACRREDLSLWLAAELWLVELDGNILREQHKLVAERGRLLRRIDEWNEESFGLFGQSALLHARSPVIEALRRAHDDTLAEKIARAQTVETLAQALEGQTGGTSGSALAVGYLLDALAFLDKEPAVAAFCAAHTALDEEGFWRERAWQSQWIVDQLKLDAWTRE